MVVKGLTRFDLVKMLFYILILHAYPVVLLAYVLAYYVGSDRIRGVAVRWGIPVLLALGLFNSFVVLSKMYKKERPMPSRAPRQYPPSRLMHRSSHSSPLLDSSEM